VSDPKRQALADNLHRVEERIVAACRRVGRPRDEVTLVAVTKTVPVEIAAILPELDAFDLAESRPQELWKKAAAITKARWHLIGHLQRNKIEPTLPIVHLIHSVDSVRLLSAIDAEATRTQRTADVLFEFNLSREPQKSGFAANDSASVMTTIAELKSVRVCGLMTMAALSDEPERSRPIFSELRQLRDELKKHIGPPHTLEHLSMGMSQDYEVAIEEGATLIRVGSALFEGVE
jgi:pyridoxal phosphate enzyme (YggS family)